jgi:hypothetical protein
MFMIALPTIGLAQAGFADQRWRRQRSRSQLFVSEALIRRQLVFCRSRP